VLQRNRVGVRRSHRLRASHSFDLVAPALAQTPAEANDADTAEATVDEYDTGGPEAGWS
jgi:hypothetical protein